MIEMSQIRNQWSSGKSSSTIFFFRHVSCTWYVMWHVIWYHMTCDMTHVKHDIFIVKSILLNINQLFSNNSNHSLTYIYLFSILYTGFYLGVYKVWSSDLTDFWGVNFQLFSNIFPTFFKGFPTFFKGFPILFKEFSQFQLIKSLKWWATSV